MRKLDSRGQMNPLLPGMIISVMLLIGAAGFGIWAYLEMDSYKNDYETKLDVAIAAKQDELNAKAEAEYTEREKSPYRNYVGPDQFGSINVTYPKTWAAYVDESSSGKLVDAHFHPNYVPGINTIGKNTQYALHLQVLDQSFEQVLKTYASEIKTGKATSQPYAVPNVSGVVGAKVTFADNVIVLLPIRDKTISLETESATYVADFENIILANITFVP